MATRQRDKQYVRQLVRLSLDEQGVVSAERVRAVLDTLRERKPRGLRGILELYERAIAVELRKSEGVLEHAGAVPEELRRRLEEHFTRLRGLPVHLKSADNPGLIAGVRVRIGDDVYEDSLQGRLKRFARQTQ